MEIGIGLPNRWPMSGENGHRMGQTSGGGRFRQPRHRGTARIPNYDDLIALVCGGRCYGTDPPHDFRPAGPAPRLWPCWLNRQHRSTASPEAAWCSGSGREAATTTSPPVGCRRRPEAGAWPNR